MNNKYFLLRHGESLTNKKQIISCWPEKGRFPLTLKGRKQIRAAIKKIKNKDIDLIFASDILRVKQTAEMIAKDLKIKPKYDKRLREYKVGVFNGKRAKEFREYFPPGNIRFKKKPKRGETYVELIKRMFDFLKEVGKRYKGKTILIISHQLPLTFLEGKAKGFSDKEILKKIPREKRMKVGELRKLYA